MNFDRLVEQGTRIPVERSSFPDRLPNQIVTLAFLSKDLPAAAISNHLARCLHAETNASVVLIRLEPCTGLSSHLDLGAGNATAVDWAPSEVIIQDQFPGPASFYKTDSGYDILTLAIRNGPCMRERFAALLDQLARQFRYVLIEAIADESSSPSPMELLPTSTPAYLFLRPKTEDIYQLEVAMRDLPAQPPSRAHFKPIVCLTHGERIEGFGALIQRVGSPVHFFLHECLKPAELKAGALSGILATDVRRLAREIGGRLVGLALSSGAAKGFAHIGVLQVLEENGIEIDAVAGASMGAYVGSIWAYGHNGAEMERLARELEGRWNFWSLIDPVFPPRQGFLRGLAVKRRLKRSIGDVHFCELPRPLRIVATNLETLERAVFSSGEVAAATHASVAVPGICVPVTIDGEAYVDGGIVDPLPVDVLREMGVARVIAVNAIPSLDRIRYGVQAARELARANPDAPARKLFKKVLPQQLNYFARGNLFEILMRSVLGAQVRVAEASCLLADLVLRPDVCDDRWLDFRNPQRFIALGREVAERKLDEIKALTGQKEMTHEWELAPEPMAALA